MQPNINRFGDWIWSCMQLNIGLVYFAVNDMILKFKAARNIIITFSFNGLL